MKIRTQLTRRIPTAVVLIVFAWYLLILIIPSKGGHLETRVELTQLTAQLHELSGKPMTREDLDSEVFSWDMNVGANHYTPQISFSSESNWVVRLIPDKRYSYSNAKSFMESVLFLRFGKMEFPIIEYSCPEKNE